MAAFNKKFRIIGVFFFIFSFLLVSCKKSKDFDDDEIENGGGSGKLDRGLRMNIDGKLWESDFFFTMTGVLVDGEEDSDMVYTNDYYTVSVTGVQMEGVKSEVSLDNIMTLGLNLIIPIHKSKFSNPKGKYPLGMPLDQKPIALCLYYDNLASIDGEEGYLSYDDKNPAKSMGELSIEEFEIGNVSFFGFPTGETGYTRIAGTFSVDLNKYDLREYDEETNPNYGDVAVRLAGDVKITKGSFNVKNEDFIKDISGFYSNRRQVDVPFMVKSILKR